MELAAPAAPTTDLQSHFAPFRARTVGIDAEIETPYGRKPLVYADWIASGRMYAPVEERMAELAPFVGNTHTETSHCGTLMTRLYHAAQQQIKAHVGAGPDDVLIAAGSGMTTVVNKLQRMMGLRLPEPWGARVRIRPHERPVVFVTHMEHHSNHTSWLETIADVVVLPPGEDGRCDPDALSDLLPRYTDRPLKIGAFIAYSNVTGLPTPYHELARRMHRAGGLCFVDFAAAAPYVDIDMRPAGPDGAPDSEARLDAVYFSPHKFLGGPGTPGILVFDRHLAGNTVPDHPGGGTVAWTNPWGGHAYLDDIEAREDGGTPPFLQTIRTALCLDVKRQMGVEQMRAREGELVGAALARLRAVDGLHVLADAHADRLGVVSFWHERVHFNLFVRLLNDRFGIQVRGGCSCAGTYGHYLLHVDPSRSRAITSAIDAGDLTDKPGWVRLSLHPTLTDAELDYVLDAVEEVAACGLNWADEYRYDCRSNEWTHPADAPTDVGRLLTLAPA
jgi:selenocysteine lyase/cysteine desulfurase